MCYRYCIYSSESTDRSTIGTVDIVLKVLTVDKALKVLIVDIALKVLIDQL